MDFFGNLAHSESKKRLGYGVIYKQQRFDANSTLDKENFDAQSGQVLLILDNFKPQNLVRNDRW